MRNGINNEVFALLSTRFYCLKIDYLIKLIGIIENSEVPSGRALLLREALT